MSELTPEIDALAKELFERIRHELPPQYHAAMITSLAQLVIAGSGSPIVDINIRDETPGGGVYVIMAIAPCAEPLRDRARVLGKYLRLTEVIPGNFRPVMGRSSTPLTE